MPNLPTDGVLVMSFQALAPLYSGNSRAIGLLAVQHLMGEKIGTEQANRAIYLHGVKDATPDQLIAKAKRLAESTVGQATKRALASENPTAAVSMLSANAELDAINAGRMNGQDRPFGGLSALHGADNPKTIIDAVLQSVINFFRNLCGTQAFTDPQDSAQPTASATPAAQAPTSSKADSQAPGIQSTPPTTGHHPANRYSPEEWKLLQTAPWNDLADNLKAKTIRFHDDPACRERNPDEPVFPPAPSPAIAVPRIKPDALPPRPPPQPPPNSVHQFDARTRWYYSQEELELLTKVPWKDLPETVRYKAVGLGHDPFTCILSAKTSPFSAAHAALSPTTDNATLLAPPVPPTPKSAPSDAPNAAPSTPFSPDPPYLRVGRADMLQALNLIHVVGQPRKTDQIVFSFDGACLHFDLCGMSTSVPAQGQWECQVRAKPAFLLPLIEVPLKDDTWLIWVKDGRLYFGSSFSCPCELQDPWQATIQLPLDNDDDMLLALGLKYSAQEIERSGLKHSVAKVEDLCMRGVHTAANALARYEVKAEDIRALVDKRIRASGILDKI